MQPPRRLPCSQVRQKQLRRTTVIVRHTAEAIRPSATRATASARRIRTRGAIRSRRVTTATHDSLDRPTASRMLVPASAFQSDEGIRCSASAAAATGTRTTIDTLSSGTATDPKRTTTTRQKKTSRRGTVPCGSFCCPSRFVITRRQQPRATTAQVPASVPRVHLLSMRRRLPTRQVLLPQQIRRRPGCPFRIHDGVPRRVVLRVPDTSA